MFTRGGGAGLGPDPPPLCAAVLPASPASGCPCARRGPHLRAVGFPGESGENAAEHPALLGILHLVAVEVVQLGASAAKHQGHGGGLQPCKQQLFGSAASPGRAGAPLPLATLAQADSPRLPGRNHRSGLFGSQVSSGRVSQKPGPVLIHREAHLPEALPVLGPSGQGVALEHGLSTQNCCPLHHLSCSGHSLWAFPAPTHISPHLELPHFLPSSQSQPLLVTHQRPWTPCAQPEHPVPLGSWPHLGESSWGISVWSQPHPLPVLFVLNPIQP